MWKDQYELVSVSCTGLTGRDAVISAIMSRCTERRGADGARELRPRSGRRLLVCLRDVDVAPRDLYGHSELCTLLWGLIAHKTIFLPGGAPVTIHNVVLCCTASSLSSIPARLRRLMGLVHMPDMN